MIRRFMLRNSIGEQVSLNDLDTFAYNPDGLGVSFANNFFGANGQFISSGTGLNQAKITMNILFGTTDENHYQRFTEFTRFLDHTPYTLEYSTDSGTYYRDMVLSDLGKTEINEWNTIDQPIEFDVLTPWYREVSGNSTQYVDQAGDGKIYVNNSNKNNAGYYVYDYVYEEDTDTNGKTLFSLNNQSVYMGTSLGSPLTVTIHGPSKNPSWEIYKDGELLYSDRFILDIPEGYTLVVSAVPQNERAELIDKQGNVQNVYYAQDFTKTNFVHVPTGTSSILFNVGSAEFEFNYREERVVV